MDKNKTRVFRGKAIKRVRQVRNNQQICYDKLGSALTQQSIEGDSSLLLTYGVFCRKPSKGGPQLSFAQYTVQYCPNVLNYL